MLYTILLSLHSILRWLVLIFALLAIIRSINGLSFKRGFTQQDSRIGMLFVTFLDLQVLIGLILYFAVSPLTTAAMQNFGGAMSNSATRYFLVEHSVMMLLALIAAHVGRSMVRRIGKAIQLSTSNPKRIEPKAAARSQHRLTIIWFAISLVIILAAIPWPFLAAGRPLLRFFGL